MKSFVAMLIAAFALLHVYPSDAGGICKTCKGTFVVSRFVKCTRCNGTGLVKSVGSGGITSRHTTFLPSIGVSITRKTGGGGASVISRRCQDCVKSSKTGYVRKLVPCKCRSAK